MICVTANITPSQSFWKNFCKNSSIAVSVQSANRVKVKWSRDWSSVPDIGASAGCGGNFEIRYLGRI